jgi:hypothetical protein
MAASKPLRVGERIACYTILAVLSDAPKSNYRRYRARADCCGREVERNELVFKRALREGVTRCHRCAQEAANPSKRADYAVGEQFGPVRILGPGEQFRLWRVQWDCCGKITEVTQHYLSVLRVREDQGRTAVCLQCSIACSRLLPQERPPRPSRSKAALAASRGLSAPIRQPITPIPKPLVTPIAAKLPEGIVPAAMAWPLPGALA